MYEIRARNGIYKLDLTNDSPEETMVLDVTRSRLFVQQKVIGDVFSGKISETQLKVFSVDVPIMGTLDIQLISSLGEVEIWIFADLD